VHVPIRALEYLDQRARFGVKFGLDTTRLLLKELGDPQRRYAVLLVAGTNGKGSVVAYVDAGLRAAGQRVGRYTSPHLVRVHERIAVDGRLIADAALAHAIGHVRDAAEALVRGGRIPAHPTHFEVLTVAALDHFARARVDVAVLEVGMGARLDATNVTEPVASAVVTVARDHEAWLGRDLRHIAREKAGVLRRGRPTVLGPLPPAARAEIGRRARRQGARLHDAAREVAITARGDALDLVTPRGAYRGVRPLPGGHQRANLAVAVRLVEAARDQGLALDLDVAVRGMSGAQWPGRLQWLPGRPPLLLDGAHNPAAARALARHLDALDLSLTLVFGAMKDKRIAAMARTLFPRAARVVLTSVGGERAASTRELRRRTRGRGGRVHVAEDPRAALALARRITPRGGAVVVAGSLYLVGAVLDLLGRAPGVSGRTL
jgi:dihydrofolate synthase / folylpolyglutamate synthase